MLPAFPHLGEVGQRQNGQGARDNGAEVTVDPRGHHHRIGGVAAVRDRLLRLLTAGIAHSRKLAGASWQVRSWGLTGGLHPPACHHPLPSAEPSPRPQLGGMTYREHRVALLGSRS
jgi:hypothetical protein